MPNGQAINWSGYQWQLPTQMNVPGTEQTLSYDPLQRVQGIDIQAGQNTLMSRAYTYDAAGNIIQRQTEEGAFTYGYDLLDRITQAVPPQNLQNELPVESYAYDAVHNRIGSSQQAGTWTYNANNQLMQYGSGSAQVSYTYTETGHIATATQAGQTTVYHYDASDRLVSISKTGVEIASYQYDPFGRRISKTVNGQTTYYLYTDEGLIAEIDDQGNMLVAYGWQPGSMYGTAPLWQVNLSSNNLQTAEFHYLHTDHLGTAQMATNGQGQVTWKANAEAFGKTLLNEENQITMNLRFPGQYYDQETDIHYNYFRDYNSSTGRYMQRDPIGLEGGINLYLYAANNSLIKFDAIGLDPGDIFPNIGSAVMDAGRYARSQPRQFLEYGGWVYPKGSGYTYNYAVGEPDMMPNEVMNRLRQECTDEPSANWHTHPDPDPNYDGRANNFSGTRSDSRVENNPHWYGKIGDIGVARRDGLDIYLVNPRNEVYRYDVKNDVILKIGDISF